MNILYIGSSGPLSYLPLQALIESQFVTLSSVAIDAVTENELLSINKNTTSLESLAFYNNIPLLKLTKSIKTNVTAIAKLQPDIILVSCYSRKLPQQIISLPKIGCFNIHPSLLPKYRGPTPLFWQFRCGEEQMGVTLHRMTLKFDDGNIIAQQEIVPEDGVTKEDITILLAEIAADLVLKTLPLLWQGKIKEIKQSEEKASYQTFPDKKDYTVSTNWTAKRLYNFICANKRTGVYFECEIAGVKYHLIDAVSYQKKAYSDMKEDVYFIHKDVVAFKCKQDYIKCIFNRPI